MRAPTVVVTRVLLAPVVALALASCGPAATDGGGEAECATAADCGDVTTACDGCPPMGEDLCLEGTCEARAADEVDVVATVNIVPRQLVVTSLVHVLASTQTATGTLSCSDAVSGAGIADGVNVLSSGYKALAGGPFHPDVTLGRVPAGDVAVLLLGTDESGGGGDVIATGCVASVSAEAPTLTLDVVNLNGL